MTRMTARFLKWCAGIAGGVIVAIITVFILEPNAPQRPQPLGGIQEPEPLAPAELLGKGVVAKRPDVPIRGPSQPETPPTGGPSDSKSSESPGAVNSTFDGEYYSDQYKWAVRIRGRSGIATLSNSPRYKVGDEMLRMSYVNGRTFGLSNTFSVIPS